MTAHLDPEQVFRHFVERIGRDADGDISAIAMFAYSIVEKERFEWRAHIRATRDREPDLQEERDWFGSKPPEYFDEIEKRAHTWYADFARLLLKDEIETAKREAVNDSVSRELAALGRFGPNFLRNIGYGVASNIAFAMLALLLWLIVTRDVSLFGMAKGQ